MTRTTKTALALGVMLLGAAIEARADCQYVRGGITETRIPSNDQLGRLLGIVTGVLNGASTVYVTSPGEIIRRLRDDHGRHVDRHRSCHTHSRSRRAR